MVIAATTTSTSISSLQRSRTHSGTDGAFLLTRPLAGDQASTEPHPFGYGWRHWQSARRRTKTRFNGAAPIRVRMDLLSGVTTGTQQASTEPHPFGYGWTRTAIAEPRRHSASTEPHPFGYGWLSASSQRFIYASLQRSRTHSGTDGTTKLSLSIRSGLSFNGAAPIRVRMDKGFDPATGQPLVLQRSRTHSGTDGE